MFVQPCETLDDIATISGKHAAPVSVDESLATLQGAARIARDGSAEIYGIKLNRVGGLTNVARLHDVALAHGIDMCVMATGGSVLADTEALHLAATISDANCHAVWPCQDMLTIDIAGARTYTGRDKILKFEGGYHGMSAEAQMSLALEARFNFPQAVADSARIPQGLPIKC